MNTALKAALSDDALAEAEKLTGTSYKKDEATSWLGIALMQDQRSVKNRLLAENNDTNSWNQSLEEWIAVVEGMGFKLLLDDAIKGTKDRLRIWWDGAVLLVSDSYNGKSVNDAKAFFNFRGPRDAMFKCSNGFACEDDGVPVWDGSVDAREGFRFALDKMRSEGSLLSQWKKQPFLWLLSYGDTKDPNYSYDKINAERISRLPAEVQAAICA